MESQNFSFITEDDKTVEVDKRIINISKLFNNIIQDYGYDNNDKKLENINSYKLQLLINFCESINYDENCIRLLKPFALNSKEDIQNLLLNNQKLGNFYYSLNENNIVEYAEIADFFDVQSLEDILYLKLNEVFCSTENIKTFFNKQLNNKFNVLEISKEREKFLYDKYMIHAEKYVNNLTDEQVVSLLDKEIN